MQPLPLPINGPAYKNVDEVSLSITSPVLYDGYVDESGSTVKMPGLLEWLNLNTAYGVDGIYLWREKSIVIAVSGGRIFKIISNGTATELTGATLNTGTRVSFTHNGTYCVMANGGQMVYTDGGTTASIMGDTDAPTAVSHVAFLDQYILALEKYTGRFHYSDINDAINWDALSFFTAEGMPDNLVALTIGDREIMLAGTDSIEIWYNDGSSPFARYEPGLISDGIGAGHTFRKVGNTFFYLAADRRIKRLEGMNHVTVSTPFDAEIQSYDTVFDATADIIDIQGKAFYVLNFPIEGKTLFYNYKDDNWQERTWWNLSQATRERWLGNCYLYVSEWNKHLVGSRRDGKVYLMSSDYLDDDGDLINFLRETAWVDHGTGNRKRSHYVLWKLKRGKGKTDNTDPSDPESIPYMMVCWKDDGKEWSSERKVSLGRIGEDDVTIRLNTKGIYRRRKWRVRVSDRTPFILVSAEEYINFLSS